MALPAFFLIALLAISTYAQGHDGDLDRTFGDRGRFTTDILFKDVAAAVALQSDGKIIVASGVQPMPGPLAAGQQAPVDFCLVRYNTEGSLDLTFGTSGVVTTDLGGNDFIRKV